MIILKVKRSVLCTTPSPDTSAVIFDDADKDLAAIEWEYYSQPVRDGYVHHIITATDESNSELLGVETGRIVCLNRVIMSRMLDEHYDTIQNVRCTYRNGSDLFLTRHNIEVSSRA